LALAEDEAKRIPLTLLLGTSLPVLLVAGALSAGPPQRPVVEENQRLAKTAISVREARHPTLVNAGNQLLLFWAEPAVVSSKPYGPLPRDVGGPAYEWPLGWADMTTYPGEPVSAQGTVSLMVVHAGTAYHRPAICEADDSLLMICPRFIWQSAAGHEAAIQEIPVPSTAPDHHRGENVIVDTPPLAALPHSLAGTEPLRMPPPDSDAAKWFVYPTTRGMDFRRLDLCRDSRGKTFYLSGEDQSAGSIWMTASEDGVHWRKTVTLAPQGYFTSIGASGGQVIVTYTDRSNQNLWWDDVPRQWRGKERFWPACGPLKYRLSRDNGKSWTEPRGLVPGKDVISSRCLWSADGTIWVVYVKTVDEVGTSLWLTCSVDGGQSWEEARQITDGKWTDRDVDIAIHEGKLIVAFARCLGPGNPNSIWIWEEALSAAKQQ
jgi:hypothetical protein